MARGGRGRGGRGHHHHHHRHGGGGGFQVDWATLAAQITMPMILNGKYSHTGS